MKSSRRSSCDNNTSSCNAAAAVAGRERERLFAGLENASAVQGPQCIVCDQYCFLTAVVCDACDGAGGRAQARSSSGGGVGGGGRIGGGGIGGSRNSGGPWTPDPTKRRRHSRVRFSCGRHLEELCGCPASEYTFYQRRDADQLRSAAGGLTSVEEHLEMWGDEARSAITAARATGVNSASSFRSASSKSGGSGVGGSSAGGSGEGSAEGSAPDGGSVKVELPSGSDASSTPLPSPDSRADGGPGKPSGAIAAKGDGPDGPDASGGGDRKSPVAEKPEASMEGDGGEEDDEDLSSSRLPAGWHERPSLRYIGDMIRVGKELKAPEPVLNELRQIVDACAGWVKTIEVILGPSEADSAASAAAAAAIRFGTAKRSASLSAAGGSGISGGSGDSFSGTGRGRISASGRGGRSAATFRGGGSRAETTASRRREQVPFHKAINLLGGEAKLPGRPVETTERLCDAILEACRLRLQVRWFLGLGDDEVFVFLFPG